MPYILKVGKGSSSIFPRNPCEIHVPEYKSTIHIARAVQSAIR